MAMRLEKSTGLAMMTSIRDELDDQKEWNTRRSKLSVLLIAIVAVTAAAFLGPHMPGWQIVSNALKSVLAAIW